MCCVVLLWSIVVSKFCVDVFPHNWLFYQYEMTYTFLPHGCNFVFLHCGGRNQGVSRQAGQPAGQAGQALNGRAVQAEQAGQGTCGGHGMQAGQAGRPGMAGRQC